MNRGALTTLVIAIFALGATVRAWAAAGTDFWFDEIWSQENGTFMTMSQILKIRHDTNHFLNTFWCHFVGDQKGWFVYRVPAVVCGSLTVLILGLWAMRRNAATALFTVVLAASSYHLIHYSSEARGYGMVMLFSVLAFVITERFLERPGWLLAITYWVLTLIGLLAHYTYFFPALACGVWSLWRGWEETRDAKTTILRAAWLHAVPGAIVVVIYFKLIKDMTIGGGPVFGGLDVLGELMVSIVAGGETTSLGDFLLVPVATALVAVECVLRWRAKDPTRMFYVALLVLTPFVTFVILNPKLLYTRYFLVVIPFLLLLLGSLLGRLWNHNGVGRIAAGVLAALCVTGNAMHTSDLLGPGRGQYLEAMQYLANETETPEIVVTFEQQPPGIELNSKVLAWYSRFLPEGRTLLMDIYPEFRDHMVALNFGALDAGPVKLLTKSGAKAQWYVIESWEAGFEPKPTLRIAGRTFTLKRTFPYASIAGWNWYLYRRDGR